MLCLIRISAGSVSNTKKEKAIQGSFSSDGKNKYTLEASHQFAKMGKKSVIASLKSLLKVNSPTNQLVSVMGSADYKEDKSLKLDGTLDIYRLLKKPANVKGIITILFIMCLQLQFKSIV